MCRYLDKRIEISFVISLSLHAALVHFLSPKDLYSIQHRPSSHLNFLYYMSKNDFHAVSSAGSGCTGCWMRTRNQDVLTSLLFLAFLVLFKNSICSLDTARQLFEKEFCRINDLLFLNLERQQSLIDVFIALWLSDEGSIKLRHSVIRIMHRYI